MSTNPINDVFIQQSYLLHRHRIQQVKKTLNTTDNKHNNYNITYNRKVRNNITNQLKQKLIDTENLRLVQRIQSIESNKNTINSPSHTMYSTNTNNQRHKFQRYDDMYKLMVDNTAMVNRLINVPPTQSRHKWKLQQHKLDELSQKLRKYKSSGHGVQRRAPGLECQAILNSTFSTSNLSLPRLRTANVASREPVLLKQLKPAQLNHTLKSTLKQQKLQQGQHNNNTEQHNNNVIEETEYKTNDNEIINAIDHTVDADIVTQHINDISINHKSYTNTITANNNSNRSQSTRHKPNARPADSTATRAPLYESYTVVRMQPLLLTDSTYGLTSIHVTGYEKLYPIHCIELQCYHPELSEIYTITVSIQQIQLHYQSNPSLLKPTSRKYLCEKLCELLLFVPDESQSMILVLELDDTADGNKLVQSIEPTEHVVSEVVSDNNVIEPRVTETN